MPKRNLLICFDAFGTLFTPKRPIAQQYGEVARSLGLGGFTDEEVMGSFKKAYKAEAKQHPNFGKKNGTDAGKWWTNIIHNTFKPLVGQSNMHKDLAPRLLHRFSSTEGYDLAPGALKLLRDLRTQRPPSIGRLVIGVITNSDDRVPDVLTSLGVRTSPFRYGAKPPADTGVEYDVDFTVMSYDAGFEKPDRRIFEAAEEILLALPSAVGTKAAEWEKVYVGDEYEKDVQGAADAGWYGVLVGQDGDAGVPEGVHSMPDNQSENLLGILRTQHPKVAVGSLNSLGSSFGLTP